MEKVSQLDKDLCICWFILIKGVFTMNAIPFQTTELANSDEPERSDKTGKLNKYFLK